MGAYQERNCIDKRGRGGYSHCSCLWVPGLCPLFLLISVLKEMFLRVHSFFEGSFFFFPLWLMGLWNPCKGHTVWSGDPAISGPVFKRMRQLPIITVYFRFRESCHPLCLWESLTPCSVHFVQFLLSLLLWAPPPYPSPPACIPLKEAWTTSREGMEPPGKESKVNSH